MFTALSVRLLGDAGIGWHIRTGQIILVDACDSPRRSIFRANFTVGQPWFAWEWLYDLLVGWLDTCGGSERRVLFTALIIAVGVRLDVPAAAAARHKYSLA